MADRGIPGEAFSVACGCRRTSRPRITLARGRQRAGLRWNPGTDFGRDNGAARGGRNLSPSPDGLNSALQNIVVVEVGDERCEFAGLLLSSLGAEVIKLEPRQGSPSRRLGPFAGS